jgi:YD repeat-containing protein
MCDPNMGTPANVSRGDCEAGIAGAWRYTYSPAGDLLTQQDAITTKGVRDQTLTFSYDLLGRPISKNQGSTTLVQWTYDSHSIDSPPLGADYPIGRLTQIDQPQTTTTSHKVTQFAYDKVGHPLEAKRQLLGAWYTMVQSYDALDRVASRTFDTFPISTDGERVTNDYNGDWVEAITSSTSTYINDIQYNARGQMAEQNGAPALTYGNNLASQFSYDPNNFRTTAHTTSGNQQNQQNMSYLYDNVGNVTQITDMFTAGRIFTYDDLNRSVTGSGTFGPSQAWQDCIYEYDSIGNMTNKCGASLEYNYPMHPSAVSRNVATGKTYEYDDNGNMTRRDTQTLTWDVDNRLISIGTTLMEYDSLANV